MNDQVFNYSGSVAVTMKVKGKTIHIKNHNRGLPYFFKAFCKFVTGYYEGVVDIPKFLDLRYCAEGSTTWSSFLTQQIEISTEYPTYDEELGNWVGILSASINHSMLVNDVQEDDPGSFRIVLYSGILDDGKEEHSRYNDLAYLPISAADLARIVPGAQALIEWRMQINNG